jgi:hypothetical protein
MLGCVIWIPVWMERSETSGSKIASQLKVVSCRNVEVCWNITSCQPVNSYRYFGGVFCVHPSGHSGPLIGMTSLKTLIFIITTMKAPDLVLCQMSPLRVPRNCFIEPFTKSVPPQLCCRYQVRSFKQKCFLNLFCPYCEICGCMAESIEVYYYLAGCTTFPHLPAPTEHL